MKQILSCDIAGCSTVSIHSIEKIAGKLKAGSRLRYLVSMLYPSLSTEIEKQKKIRSRIFIQVVRDLSSKKLHEPKQTSEQRRKSLSRYQQQTLATSVRGLSLMEANNTQTGPYL